MRPDNATFAAFNLGESRRPRYTVEIDFSTAGTDLVYLTSHAADDDAHPGGLTQGVDLFAACIQTVSGSSQKIDPLKGSATIGNISIKAIDNGLTGLLSTKLAAGKGSRLKRVRVYVGFEGMAWVDYELRHTYLIQDIEYNRGVYTFSTEDIQREARKEIFIRQRYQLKSSISATDTKIYVTAPDTAKFPTFAHDAAYTDAPSATVGYVRIEDTKEVVRHTGLASDGGGIYLQVAARGALGTTAVAHDVDPAVSDDRKTEVIEWIYIEGPAPLIAYNVLTGTTYPSHWTLGIDTSFVRLADFQAYPDLYDTTDVTAGRQMRFEGLDKIDGKKWLEEEIMLWLGAFMPVYSDGALGLKKLTRILAGSGYVMQLDESNIVSYGPLKQANSEVVNDYLINWNWVASPKLRDEPYFSRRLQLIDSNSIATHQASVQQEFSFLGVHTGVATDNDLRLAFDSLRDSYAGPPLYWSCEAFPVGNVLEVGDVVRGKVSTIQDPVSGSALDRSFQTRGIDTDWRTGRPKLSLFASSAAPGALSRTTAATVISDAWYTGTGTELSTVLTISAGAVTTNGTLTGSATSTPTVFYFDGDLTINAGVTVTLTGNWQLRIKGFLQINGDLDAAGNGHAGGTGQTTVADNSTNGTAGYWSTFAGGGVSASQLFGDQSALNTWVTTETGTPNRVIGTNVLEFFETRWDGTDLAPLPQDLRGSSGGGGLAAINAPEGSPTPTPTVAANGSNGGDSGSGGVIISRGGAFGASGAIDLSGTNPAAQNSGTASGGLTVYGGTGAPGMPGALVWFIDGNNTAPDLVNNTTALPGTATFNTSAYRLPVTGRVQHGPLSQGIRSYHEPTIAFDSAAHSAAATRIQYVLPSETVEQELEPDVHQIATPSAPTLATATVEPKLPGDSGAVKQQIKVTLAASTDPDYIGSQIQAKRNSESDWQPVSGAPDPTQTIFYFEATQGVQYDVRARYLSQYDAGHSDWSSTASTTVTASAVTVGSAATGAAESVITVDTSGDVTIGRGTVIKATDSFESGAFYYRWFADSGDAWSLGTTGAGATALYTTQGMRAQTTGSVGKATCYMEAMPLINALDNNWTNDRRMKFRFNWLASSATLTGRIIYVGMGGATNNFVGFKIDAGALKGAVKNSSGTESVTATLKTYTGSANDNDTFEFYFNAGTDVTFWLNGGSETTLSTNLPSGSANSTRIAHIDNDNPSGSAGTLGAALGEMIIYITD